MSEIYFDFVFPSQFRALGFCGQRTTAGAAFENPKTVKRKLQQTKNSCGLQLWKVNIHSFLGEFHFSFFPIIRLSGRSNSGLEGKFPGGRCENAKTDGHRSGTFHWL